MSDDVTGVPQVCVLEETESVRHLMWTLGLEPGQLCDTFTGLQMLLQSLQMNTTTLSDTVFQTLIGDPSTFDVQTNW